MISGVLNIYKEKGYTSHDVVACLRRIVGQKKIGHTGTLDPDAEGVLPVCLGRATKLCDMLTDRNKTYEAVLLLGKTTDTQDISGTVLKECDTSGISDGEAAEHIYRFVGEYDQIPPMYSALKVNGKKLYELFPMTCWILPGWPVREKQWSGRAGEYTFFRSGFWR